ncbi:hypothetical protein N7466_004049 [Penicillium verhagenii]|uniref:uncharacterized protein n=1 Tax=Penicillium verhagenii TaxID=1562060 RepID=UPI0025452D71|nr:uncharacterized protein N7466_004049 [Penicillium verhagenii]KAJ5934502.1 hypothetical protein N7466_004049 [Penicillium verhagenii]
MSDRRPTNDLPVNQGVPGRDDLRQQASSTGTPRSNTSSSIGTSSGTSSASSGQEPPEIVHYRALVNKLLSFIATGDEEAVARVISTIRTGASHDQILEEIDLLTTGLSLANGDTNGTHPGRS